MKVGLLSIVALASLASASPAILGIHKSNTITDKIPTTGRIVPRNLRNPKNLWGDCSQAQWDIVFDAMENCAKMAVKATKSAAEDEFKLMDYFGSDEPAVRDRVISVLHRVDRGCARDHSRTGVPEYVLACWTRDVPACFVAGEARNAGAYSNTNTPYGRMDVLNICPGFFYLKNRSGLYYEEDQSSIMVHEMTHITDETEDYGFYYSDYAPFRIPTTRITNDEKLNHADTYAFYAQAVWNQQD